MLLDSLAVTCSATNRASQAKYPYDCAVLIPVRELRTGMDDQNAYHAKAPGSIGFSACNFWLNWYTHLRHVASKRGELYNESQQQIDTAAAPATWH